MSSWSKTKERREERDGGLESELGLEPESEFGFEGRGREDSRRIMEHAAWRGRRRRREREAEVGVAMRENRKDFGRGYKRGDTGDLCS